MLYIFIFYLINITTAKKNYTTVVFLPIRQAAIYCSYVPRAARKSDSGLWLSAEYRAANKAEPYERASCYIMIYGSLWSFMKVWSKILEKALHFFIGLDKTNPLMYHILKFDLN